MTNRRDLLKLLLATCLPMASCSENEDSTGTSAQSSAGGAAGAAGGGGASGGSSGSGGAVDATCDAQGASVVMLGMPSDYASVGLHQVTHTEVLVGRDSSGLYFARSAVCTNLDCNLDQPPETLPGGTFTTGGLPMSDGGIECLCCQSIFGPEGDVVMGPAPRALDALAMSLCGDGHFHVDPRTKVDASYRVAGT